MSKYLVTVMYTSSIEWEADTEEDALDQVLDTDFGLDVVSNTKPVFQVEEITNA